MRNDIRSSIVLQIAMFIALFICTGFVDAQSSSLFGDPATRQPVTLMQSSWTYVPPAEPDEITKGDLIKVIVKRKSMAISEGEIDNKKKASGKWALTDWIMFNGLSLKPDPQGAGDPAISGKVDTKYKAEAGVETLESIEFTIMCRVVDLRPNGLLVVEGDDRIQVNDEQWTLKISGIISPDDVLPDGSVLGEEMHQLWIEKDEVGAVRDGYRRGWLQKIIDNVQPI